MILSYSLIDRQIYIYIKLYHTYMYFTTYTTIRNTKNQQKHEVNTV